MSRNYPAGVTDADFGSASDPNDDACPTCSGEGSLVLGTMSGRTRRVSCKSCNGTGDARVFAGKLIDECVAEHKQRTRPIVLDDVPDYSDLPF